MAYQCDPNHLNSDTVHHDAPSGFRIFSSLRGDRSLSTPNGLDNERAEV
jgi:hypothetical protein